MNVSDMAWHGKPVSRLEFSKALLKQTIKDIPCHSRVGLGLFLKQILFWCTHLLKYVAIPALFGSLLTI